MVRLRTVRIRRAHRQRIRPARHIAEAESRAVRTRRLVVDQRSAVLVAGADRRRIETVSQVQIADCRRGIFRRLVHIADRRALVSGRFIVCIFHGARRRIDFRETGADGRGVRAFRMTHVADGRRIVARRRIRVADRRRTVSNRLRIFVDRRARDAIRVAVAVTDCRGGRCLRRRGRQMPDRRRVVALRAVCIADRRRAKAVRHIVCRFIRLRRRICRHETGADRRCARFRRLVQIPEDRRTVRRCFIVESIDSRIGIRIEIPGTDRRGASARRLIHRTESRAVGVRRLISVQAVLDIGIFIRRADRRGMMRRGNILPVAGCQRSLRIVADGIAIADRRGIIRRLPDAAADPEQGRIGGRDRAVRTERDRIRQSHTRQRDVHIRAEGRRARAVRQDIVADRRRLFLRRFAVRPKDARVVAGRQEIVDRVTRAVADRRRSDAAGHRMRADRRGVLVPCLRFVADRRRFACIVRISLHTGESLRADRRGIGGVRRRGNADRRRIHGIVIVAVFRVRTAARHFRADRHIVRGRIIFRRIRFVRAECILDPDRNLVIALRRIFVAEGNAVIARRRGFIADRHAGIAIRFGLETHRHGFVSVRFTLVADSQGIVRIVNCAVFRIRAAGRRAVADGDIVRGHLAFRRLGRIRLRLVVETDLDLALRICHIAAAVGDGVFAIGGISVAHGDRAFAVCFIRGADRCRIVCRRFIGIADRRRIHRIVFHTGNGVRATRYIRAADG